MRVQPRPTPSVRCAYCHGDLGPVFNRCPVCHTSLHLDCWQRLEACPILGCAGRLGAAAPAPTRSLRWLYGLTAALLLLGVTAGALSQAERRPAPPVPAPSARILQDAPELLDVVLEASRSEEVSLRLGAVLTLAQRGGPEAAKALCARLEDRNLEVRLAAVRGLGQIDPGGRERAAVIADLKRALRYERTSEVRVALVQALAARDVQSLTTISGLTRDGDRDVRRAAIQAVAQAYAARREPLARSVLEQAAKYDRSWEIRNLALRALQEHRPRQRPPRRDRRGRR